MNPNNQTIETDEIDLGEIIRRLWKEKFLILSISLIVSALAYVYVAFKPKTFQTTVVLRNIPSTLFVKFDTAINLQKQQQEQQQQITFASLLEDEIHQKLNSFDNLDQFVKQNDSINSFKALIKKKQISAKDYFFQGNKFGPEKEKNKILKNRYYLNFPKELKGDEFLNEYVLFTFQKSQNLIKNQIVSIFSSLKNDYENNLVIAKQLNIQEPILQQKLQDRSLFMINEPKELYYSGTKVIQNEINILNKLIAEAKDFKLNFNPILDRAYKPIIISVSPLKFVILGFFVGLILSMICIFLRDLFKAKV
ncbi:Wzz/FepE/Etk N-terminal domain-containing protein [Pelagibacteraceae bacterium]|nr:Wzz/FepE/Etk N-terminal domain-containing protein [Pelagibacteraceae bacterium]